MRYALRRLLRSPGFTILAVLTLAIGVGANTAVFSVVNAVLLRALPYPEPDNLILLRERSAVFQRGSVSFPNYVDWREGARSFADMALYRREDYNVAVIAQDGRTPEPERVAGARMTANLPAIVGLPPQLGRNFTAEEDTPNGPRVVMLSDSLWRRLFNAAPSVVGQRLLLNGEERLIVGVLHPSYAIPNRAEIAVPLGELRAARNTLNRSAKGGYSVLGRLKPGVSLEQAAAELDVIAAGLEKKYPESNSGYRVWSMPLLAAVVVDYRKSLFLLLGAVGGVLLIACANVANLQLARAAARARELAVRSALGASRSRMARELFAESAWLALMGGTAGALAGWWSLAAIRATSPGILRFQEIQMDWAAFAFAAGIALVAALLVGAWPAWRAAGAASIASPMQEGDARGASGGPRRTRAQSALVVTQVALALVLLTGASLLIQSLRRAQEAALGFDAQGVLTVELSLPRARYEKNEARAQFYSALLERVRALPGVSSAAFGDNIPFDNGSNDNGFHVTGTPPDQPGKEPTAEISYVSADYFRTLGIPILRGRTFNAQDTPSSPRVIIIDDTLAAKHFPGVDPIGRQIDNFDNPDLGPLVIVGVVPRTRNDGPDDSMEALKLPQLYFCSAQEAVSETHILLKGAAGFDVSTLGPLVRREVSALDSAQPATVKGSIQAAVEKSLASRRLTSSLLGTFSSLALGLAVLGLYGVLALMVTSRTREFGIRLALGAQKWTVLGLVLRQGLALVGVGLAIGLGASLAFGRLVDSLLVGVSAFDVKTLLGVMTLLSAAALCACLLPARKATRVDPAIALRGD